MCFEITIVAVLSMSFLPANVIASDKSLDKISICSFFLIFFLPKDLSEC